MGYRMLRPLGVLLLAITMLMPVVPGTASTGSAGDDARLDPITPVQPAPWYDDLDDHSHVYIPPGGLVGVEVTGGAAQLLPDANEGWIATSVIGCPVGFRFNVVMIEVDMPGSSHVEVSVLDATRESDVVGFANATIPGFVKRIATDLSLSDISPQTYPYLRIQVNLNADGTDRPRLLAWSVHYVAKEEWRDDFVGVSKVLEHKGINITNGRIEIDLSGGKQSSGGTDYEPYPTILIASGSNGLQAYYPNAGRTGYLAAVALGELYVRGVAVDDLNTDGYLDLVLAKSSMASKILWGVEDGTWSSTGAKTLQTDMATRVATGDFDGDGEVDLAFACSYSSGDVDSVVFLNQGGGVYNNEPDITFAGAEYTRVDTGDLNQDGYDDIVMTNYYAVHAYLGGVNGPDTVVDIDFPVDTCMGVRVVDVNGDGHLDVAPASKRNGKTEIFLGGPNGPDTTADYSLTVDGTGFMYDVAVGDLNGDGYTEMLYYAYASSSTYKVNIFEGTASGWTDSKRHTDIHEGFTYSLGVLDVDKDGYDDLVMSAYEYSSYTYKFKLYQGGTTWPSTPVFTTDGFYCYELVLAVPKRGTSVAYRGTLTTENITLPDGKKWDMVHLDATLPMNTTISMSVLDSDGHEVAGFEDLEARSVDLSELTERKIRIRVTMASEFNNTTPVLDSLMVKWMDEMSWREQFLGMAKIERLFNLAIEDNTLRAAQVSGTSSQLLFANLRGDDGYNVRSRAFFDAGGFDFTTVPPVTFKTSGASAVAAADVNGDGFTDVAFATHQTTDTNYHATSPLFLGSAVGWRSAPDHEFPSVGASNILLEDLDGDGHCDVVIAQERDGDDYHVNSSLFWGSSDGWSTAPDVTFQTTGATGVAAADLNGDGMLDLAFSCYRSSSTSTDSMVFLQEAAGFCGTTPAHLLATKGARAVAAADIDGDSCMDLAFANSLSGGFAEIDSYIYWGKAGGGFEATPTGLPTLGAEDVKVVDVDVDGDLDIVFANHQDNTLNKAVDSFIYLGSGDRSLSGSPDVRLPTLGASAVALADLDGTGWRDVVYACRDNGTSHEIDSRVFLGGPYGLPAAPDVLIPTMGASDVLVAGLVKQGSGGYMSRSITVDPAGVGDFDTLRCVATLGPSQTGSVQLVDATTWEVLAETPLADGTNAWTVPDTFKIKSHPSIRVVVTVEGLDGPGAFGVEELFLNWTPRVRRPPTVDDLEVSGDQVYRLKTLDINVTVSDEYDPCEQLTVTLEHRLKDTTAWGTFLLKDFRYHGGAWRAKIAPKANAAPGEYVFRVNVTDTDLDTSGYVEFPLTVEVLNNLPTSPEVRLVPVRPVTTSTLNVEIARQSTDLESSMIQYHYRWFRDGEPIEDATSDSLPPNRTRRGDNITVEVRAFDGEDEGPPAHAWVVVQNAAPRPMDPLPDPVFDEDTTDTNWLDLSTAFEDPDGDPLAWSVSPPPTHVTVSIDHVTGAVTLVPEENWNGEEEITFIASDGELQASQTVTVGVTAVNDAPRIIAVDGDPVEDDPVVYVIMQGELLVISLTVVDVEGHDLVYEVNSSMVELDDATGEIRFEPDNDAVGILRFGLWVFDVVSPSVKVKLNFSIEVINENDPMDDPRITNPGDGDLLDANKSFSLSASCFDPDVQYGQELNYTWTSDISGLLGHGSYLAISIAEPGTHTIMLTVNDGEFQKTDSIVIEVLPDDTTDPDPHPDPDPTDNGSGGGPISGLMVGLLAVLLVAGAAGFAIVTKRRADRTFADDDEEDTGKVLDEKAALRRMAEAVRESADILEESKENGDTWVETEVEDGIEVSTAPVPAMQLSMEAKVAERASSDVARLWKDIDENGKTVAGEDREALRLDNLKRKYHNAIGRLPYGIPSSRLNEMEWIELASALATGPKRTVEDGREVTEIDGRWYYSDMEDTGSFLKEHGGRPDENERKGSTRTDRETLLATLEERFIMGEITEDTYKELKEKYGRS